MNTVQSTSLTPLRRLQQNLTVLEALRADTNVDISLFTGFGGIADILKPESELKGAMKQSVQDLKEICSELDKKYNKLDGDFFDSFKNNVLTAYYTPQNIITPVFDALKPNFTPTSFLDPSAGMGAFYEALPEEWKKAIEPDKLRMVELDAASALLLEKKYGTDVVKGISFADFNSMKDFDLVASNVPFSEEKTDGNMNLHSYFIHKSMDLLKDGGVGVFMTSTYYMDAPGSEANRTALLENNMLLGAYRLPNDAFKHTNTAACADLIILQKGRTHVKTPAEKAFCNEYAILRDTDKQLSVQYNAYYKENWRNLLGVSFIKGQYARPSFDLSGTGDLPAMLKTQLASTLNAPQNVMAAKNIQKATLQGTLFNVPPVREKQIVYPVEVPAQGQSVNFEQSAIKQAQMKAYLMQVVDANGTADINDVVKLSGEENKECFRLLKPYVFFDPVISKVVLRENYINAPNPKERLDELQRNIEKRKKDGKLKPHQESQLNENIAALKGRLPSVLNLGDMSSYGLPDLKPEQADSFYNVVGTKDALWVHNNQLGHIDSRRIDGKLQYSFQPINVQNPNAIKKYVELKCTYLVLNHLDKENNPESARIRELLNRQYDEFKRQYGTLNGTGKGKSTIIKEIDLLDVNFPVMTGLEVKNLETEKWEKSDIFTKNTIWSCFKKYAVIKIWQSGNKALILQL